MKTKKLSPVLLGGAAAVLLTAFYMVCYRFSFEVDADNVFYLRTAAAMRDGNPLLKGWYGGFYNPWTSDFLWIGLLQNGLSGKMMLYGIGPLSYTLMLISAFLLVKQRCEKWLKAVLILSPLLLIPQIFEKSMLSVGIHGISMFYLVLCFIFFDSIRRNGLHLYNGTAFLLLLTFCSLNDGWVVYFFALPLVVVLACDLLRSFTKNHLALLLLTGAGCGLNFGIQNLLKAVGAIRVSGFTPDFYPLDELPSGFWKTFTTLCGAFGISFNESLPAWLNPPRSLAGVGLCLAILTLVILVVLRWKKFDLTDRTLALGCVFTLGVYTLTRLDTDAIHYHYIFPFLVLGVILLGRNLDACTGLSPWLGGLLIGIALLFGICDTAPSFSLTPKENEQLQKTADFLIERSITKIYTPYWESHTLWYDSRGQVEAAPVTARDSGDTIQGLFWASNGAWYEADFDCHCMGLAEDAYIYNLSFEKMRAQFGEPLWHEKAGAVNIYCYEANLSEILENANTGKRTEANE